MARGSDRRPRRLRQPASKPGGPVGALRPSARSARPSGLTARPPRGCCLTAGSISTGLLQLHAVLPPAAAQYNMAAPTDDFTAGHLLGAVQPRLACSLSQAHPQTPSVPTNIPRPCHRTRLPGAAPLAPPRCGGPALRGCWGPCGMDRCRLPPPRPPAQRGHCTSSAARPTNRCPGLGRPGARMAPVEVPQLAGALPLPAVPPRMRQCAHCGG
jgi:hypothetical protein